MQSAEIYSIPGNERARRAVGKEKRSLRSPSVMPLPVTKDLIEERLSEEVDYARRLVEAIGSHLLQDPVVANRHVSLMRSFNAVSSLLGDLSRVMATSAREEAIERIGNADLRRRLSRKPAKD